MFRSLGVRNYRLYASGQLVSLTGTWMQRVAQDWLVLELTNSGTALGVVTALQFGPSLLLGLWGGVLADRSNKRRLLFATQTGLAIVALLLGLLTVTGRRRLLARLGARARARAGDVDRHPGAAVIRGRDGRQGRSGQRGRDQLDDLQHRTDPRPGGRRRHDQRGRHRLGLPRERSLERGGACRARRDAAIRVAPGTGNRACSRPVARRIPLRARTRRPRAHHDLGVRDRHVRLELPDHHRADRQAGVQPQRHRLRAALDRPRRRGVRRARSWPRCATDARPRCS